MFDLIRSSLRERAEQHEFTSFDGARLAYWTLGEGPPVVMLHGFLSNARFNWIDPGLAAAVARAGFKAIMPDLRGHGSSAAPEEMSAYPPDVLALDGLSLVQSLQLKSYQLVGYSLGARTAVRMLMGKATPSRVVLAGMGESGVTGISARAKYFEDLITKGDASGHPRAARLVAGMIQRGGLKQRAVLNVLYAQLSTPADALHEIATPILVVSGAQDHDNGSAENLAAMFPHAEAVRVPGDHVSAVNKRGLAEAITEFLQK